MKRITRVAPTAAALAFSLFAATGFGVSSAYAAPIYNYGFSPNASMTIAGVNVGISGTFGFDAGTDQAVNLNITLTDTNTHASEAFTAYSNVTTDMFGLTELTFPGNNTSGDFFGLNFGSSLALDAVDPLALIGSSVPSGCHCHSLDSIDADATAVTGSVVPVPEPVTLSLFGAGLAGAVAMRRRRKKA